MQNDIELDKQPRKVTKAKRRKKNQSNPSQAHTATSGQVRRELAIVTTTLFVIIALFAVYQIGALQVLDKLLPLIAMIFGFFFATKSSS